MTQAWPPSSAGAQAWPPFGGVGAGAGELEIEWREITTTDQGTGTSVAPGGNTNGFRASGGFNTVTSTLNVAWPSGASVNAPGHQQGLTYWSVNVSDIFPE